MSWTTSQPDSQPDFSRSQTMPDHPANRLPVDRQPAAQLAKQSHPSIQLISILFKTKKTKLYGWCKDPCAMMRMWKSWCASTAYKGKKGDNSSSHSSLYLCHNVCSWIGSGSWISFSPVWMRKWSLKWVILAILTIFRHGRQGWNFFLFHSFREMKVKKKWLEIEIEKWKWNKNCSRSEI